MESSQTGLGVSVKGDDIQIYAFMLPLTNHEKQGWEWDGAKALACGTLRKDEHLSGHLSFGLRFSILTITVTGKVSEKRNKDANMSVIF